ncbi:MAG TPA: hypothetical protein VFS84_18075, partial [Candidatus Binatia bacterium]|nr:hypothetical protein [Candidatus Binatia bacterium]
DETHLPPTLTIPKLLLCHDIFKNAGQLSNERAQEDVTFKSNIHFIESHGVLRSRRRQLPDMNQQVIELNRLVKIPRA